MTDKKHAFSIMPFNSEMSVLTGLEYSGLLFDSELDCYTPPIDRFRLAKLPFENAQHCGILQSRINMVSAGYEQGGLSKQEMKALCQNLIQFGDVGILKIRNGFGKVIRLEVLSSLYLRKTKGAGYRYLMRRSLTDSETNLIYHYQASDIIFIKLYDPCQQVYGVPDYVGGIQSALLNSDATTFRRRYYKNGAHMGFILYSTDPNMTEEMEEAIRESIVNSKGVGNFKSMYVNVAGGDPDGLKLIPVGDVSKKDEFTSIKDVSAQDILTAHRYPPGLGGIIPSKGNFGDIKKIREAYRLDEILPLRALIEEAINCDADIPPQLKVKFKQENGETV